MHERAATHLASLRRGQAELEEEVHEAERAHQRERDLWQRSRAALVADVDRLKRLEGEKSNGALAAQELEELRRQMEALQDEHRKHVAEMEASHSKVIEELEAVLKKRQAEHDAALLLERERLLEASAQKEALEAKVVVMTENLAAKEVEAVSNVTQELVVARKQLVDAIALKEALEVELSVKSQRLLEAEARVERVGGELRSRIAELEAAENSGVAELRKKLAESEESARLADSTLAESNKLVAALRKELAELELKEKEALEELRARGERARLLFEEELRELEASKAAMVEELRVKLTQCDQTNKAMVELLREAEADGKREVEDLRAKLARSEETSKDLQDKLQRGEASAKQEVEELKVKLSQCEQTRKTLSEMLSRDSAVVVGSSPPVDDETSLKLKELSQSHEMELEKMAAALEAKMKRLEARAPRAPIPDNSNNVAVASAQEETENARQLADFEARLSETTLALRRANDALEQRALELGRVREELEGERIRAVSAVKSKYNAKIRRLVSSERERAANRIEEVEGKARVVPRASGLGTFVWWMLLVLCLMRVFIAPMFEV
jgi:DNA repair exonuclease SbcCD ATPase subunit